MLKMQFFFQKKYKEEMGKYQLAIRSSKNKAALTDEKVRYKRWGSIIFMLHAWNSETLINTRRNFVNIYPVFFI